MDPHSPYLPPVPYERIFYHGNETRPQEPARWSRCWRSSRSATTLPSWMPPGIHGQGLRHRPVRWRRRLHGRLHPVHLHRAGRRRASWTNTIVVINLDHGETLYDHDCYFDHHGLYDADAARAADHPLSRAASPPGDASRGYSQHKDLVAHAAGAGRASDTRIAFDGQSLLPWCAARSPQHERRVLHHRVHLDAQARLAHPAVEAHPSRWSPTSTSSRRSSSTT